MTNHPTARLTIDLDALARNYHRVAHAGASECVGRGEHTLKHDAYTPQPALAGARKSVL